MYAGGEEVDRVTRASLAEKVTLTEKRKGNGRVSMENVLSIQNVKLKRAIIPFNLSNNTIRSY